MSCQPELLFYPWDFTFILYIREMKSTSSSSHQILDRSQITNKIMRLAYQIWEDHHEEEMIHVLGVSKAGAILAKELCNALNSIRNAAKLSGVITLNKANPLSSPISCSCSLSDLENQSVLCVDDVSNSGRLYFMHWCSSRHSCEIHSDGSVS